MLNNVNSEMLFTLLPCVLEYMMSAIAIDVCLYDVRMKRSL